MYTPQIGDLRHTLDDVAGFRALVADGVFPDLSPDLVEAVLAEAGRFAAEVIAPLNRAGDRDGCRLDAATGEVATAPGWRDAYAAWCAAGWAALPGAPEHGGQGLPVLLSLAVQELWNTAASAYGIGTLLTQGAVEALAAHGSPELKARYLPRMVSGEWTGTMNLTEPQAGSDLGAIATRAEPAGDGTYRITGTKIFITYGDHDLTDNIVHLVLARLPDAPPGSRGLSLFLVPKVLVGDDGTPGARNDVKCIGLEHKLGIHGSPTCTMRYGDAGGAVGWLVGEENRGLACMFTMMNNARLHVGMQGVAIAERAFQQARAYARERRQGRRPDAPAGPVPIVEHADVRRMLMDMKALTQAARSVCFLAARALDLAGHGADAGDRAAAADLAALLTPVAKAFATDIGVEVASLGLQVHGGMGYIEETGAAQHYRDARITPIYEGTNGIQAIDLVTRKLPLAGGATVAGFLARLEGLESELTGSGVEPLMLAAPAYGRAVAALAEATARLGKWLAGDDERAVAAATPYLRLFGLAAGAYGLGLGALGAVGRNDGEAATRARLFSYFCANHLPATAALRDVVSYGADELVAVTPDLIGA